MSQVTLQGNASGTGIFTLAAPNSNTNRTLNLPDAAGDVVLTTATQTLTNKSISAAQINSGTLGVARGGTGASTLTANNVLLGNGTSALQAVAPGTSGNVLTSNGTTWTSAAPGGAPAVVNTFNSNGTWTKPATGTMARIQVWGGGGGGGRAVTASSSTAHGGGGGGYIEIIVPLSTLGATVTVTIGAGGAGRASTNGSGSPGGNTSFGALISVSGGDAGRQSSTSASFDTQGLGPEEITSSAYFPAFFNGGGTSTVFSGGTQQSVVRGSVYGGGSGGWADSNNNRALGKASVFGGAGGDGGFSTTFINTAGTAPGGGGGASGYTANGSNGAAGRVIVTVW